MPKSQKSPIAVNQQGHALSYVLGVYFGDACIDKAWVNADGSEVKRMRLRVIDKDFIEYFAACLEEAFPDAKPSIAYDISHHSAGRFGKAPMHSATIGRGIPEYIESVAGKRTVIPNIVYSSAENKRAFIEGILDSEGWVAIHYQDLGRFYLQIGFAMTSEMVYEIKKMLAGLGIKTGNVQTKRYKSGKIMKTVLFNTTSFMESGLQFHIARKQDRIVAFQSARKALEQVGFRPNGASFNDYKREFRESVQDGLRAKE